MVVKEAVDILKSRNCRQEDKVTAYASLVGNMKSDVLYEEELKTHGMELLRLLYRDILNTDEKIVLNALSVFYVCLQSEHISFQKSDSECALKALIHSGYQMQSVDVIKKIFDCLSVQRFHSDVLTNEISVLLDFIEAMNAIIKAQSVPVVDKIVKIFVRLEEQIGSSLRPSSPQWARLVFPGLVNSSENVREMSLTLLEKFRATLCGAPDLSKYIIKSVNAGLAKVLKGLMVANEVYVLRTWPLIVQVAGKELHKGSTINSLLEIVEMGFKGSHVAKHNAFIAWRSLIDNYALDKAVISDPKRIKLLLMVLKIDIAKVENVAVEKLYTWWHFCSCLGAKLAANFEIVVHPLLQCCAGSGKGQFPSDLTQTSRLALKTTAVMSPQSSVSKNTTQVFLSVQKLGCEIIAHLISKVGKSEDPGKIIWKLDPLPEDIFGSPAVFVKHAPVIMATLQKLLLSIGNEIEENLVLHIWISLGNHLKAALDSSVKTECRDIFSNYLTILHSIVQNQVLQSQTVLKMIQICCGFPQKVLASTAYNITGGQTVRGCPAQLLCEVLLHPFVIKDAVSDENFIKLFSALVNAGASNLQGALLFLQSVTEMLDSQALLLASADFLWRMWSTLANTLQDTISSTNEVNQGDALEYNFGCMHAMLLLPVRHQLSSKVSQAVYKTLLKTWKELYHSFARLSALVATAEANACLEEMSAKIIQNWNPELQDPVNLEFLSNLCHKMIDCADFSAISVSQSPGGGLTLSPSKWVRRRQRPMGNFHSFVYLLATLQTEFNVVLSKIEDAGLAKKQDSSSSVILIAHTLIEVYTKLFMHITSASVISNCLAVLASPMARFYQLNTNSGSVKLFVNSFLVKLEKLWQEIAQCITGRCNSQYDSEFLNNLSPLLEVTFLHPRRAIKNQTLTLWNTTFGRMSTLEYPSSLKHTLMKMKEKNTILLPGFISIDESAVVAETPFSELNMGDSQIPTPALPLLASPKRPKGSLLNRDLSPAGKLSPKPKASPAKVYSPREARNLFSGSRKRIDLDLLPKEDFVVINSPVTRKKRLLTEHQKEVLKQRSVLPAMYNNVDSSQDVSLMSQFGTETQQSVSCADVIVVNSSESPELPNKSLSSLKLLKPDGVDDSSTFEGMGSAISSRRRSVRIQELQSCNNSDAGCAEIQPSAEVISQFTEPEVKQKKMKSVDGNMNSKVTNTFKDGEKGAPEENNSKILVRTLQCDSGEAQPDNSGSMGNPEQNQTPLKEQKNQDSPFVMFRTLHTAGKVSLSQNNIGAKSPNRVSLRKVKSQDNIPCEIKSDEMCPSKSPSPPKMKMPRRVPLKKINEQEFECDSESFKHKAAPSGEKSKQSSLTTSSTLDNWIVPLKHFEFKKTEQLSNEVSIDPQAEPVESDSSFEVSGTLVEDTQSPFKVKQSVHSADHSIAETPLKGENSNSPPLRIASARKLFADGDTEGISQSVMVETEPAVEKVDEKNKEPLLNENSEILSSQGFDVVDNKNIQKATEQNRHDISLSNHVKECTESEKCVSDLQNINQPESESLFTSTETCNPSLDMMMPTVSSSLGHNSQMNTLNSSACDSNKASSSSSSELSNKQRSSSEEYDFHCLQPTMADEVLMNSQNKRKRGTPKKFLQIKGRRNSKRNSKIKKACQCCKSPGTTGHNKCKFSSENNSSKNGKKTNPSFSSFSSQDNESSAQLSSLAEEVLIPDAPGSLDDSEVAFTKVKNTDRALKEIGEVTPDMKSPISKPERGHSSVKRRGGPQKRKLENSNESESSTSKKIRIESFDNSESGGNVKKGKNKDGGKNEKSILKLESPDEKRKSLLSRLGKHKHLLKTRSKARSLVLSSNQPSLPKKRKLKPEYHDSGEEEDCQPLSSYLSKSDNENKASLNKNVSDDIDTDDIPLSQLKNASSNVAVENSQQSDAKVSTTNSENPESPCSKSNWLVFDAALKNALNRVFSKAGNNDHTSDITVQGPSGECSSESTIVKVTKDNISSEKRDDGTSEVCSSLVSETSGNSTNVSHDDQQTGQEVMMSPTDEPQKFKEVEDLSELGSSECEDAVENIEIMEISKSLGVQESITPPDYQQDVRAENTECSNKEKLQVIEIPQPDTATEECPTPKNVHNEEEPTHHDTDVTEQKSLSKPSPEELNTDQECSGKQETSETGLCPDCGESPSRTEHVYQWSPTRSPSCSILKRCTETPPSGKNLRVSFAEPVVSGESPVRAPKEFTPTSPLISPSISSPGQKVSFFNSPQGRISKYRRRLESSKKEPVLSRLSRKIVSPQTQLSYKPTQESQLSNSGPVFPELVDCTNPLDDILPQLTSSLWYRGLCQLMKGRNINTIGDLSSLTEVQIDQLPIRHPKVECVKFTLSTYMAQHGLGKSTINTEEGQENGTNARSKGSTIEPEVTPADIDNEEILVHPNAENDLKDLSPIKDPESEPSVMSPVFQDMEEGNGHAADGIDTAEDPVPTNEMVSHFKNIARQCSNTNLKTASMAELFEVHQSLSLMITKAMSLVTNVVDEIKSRQPSL